MYGEWDNFNLEQAHVIPALVRKYIEAADREQLREKAGMIGRSLFLGFFSAAAKFIADDEGRVVVERC